MPIFITEWSKNGFNATQAYLAIHPNVTENAARILGCRKLATVSKSLLLSMYGVDLINFFDRLKEGLKAEEWNRYTGEKVPDHKTRLKYLKIAGKLLDLPV